MAFLGHLQYCSSGIFVTYCVELLIDSEMKKLRREVLLQEALLYTVWKFKNFSVPQFFREINGYKS